MNDQQEHGNAFAIPDLWKGSSLVDINEHLTAYPVPLGLEPLSMSVVLNLPLRLMLW